MAWLRDTMKLWIRVTHHLKVALLTLFVNKTGHREEKTHFLDIVRLRYLVILSYLAKDEAQNRLPVQHAPFIFVRHCCNLLLTLALS